MQQGSPYCGSLEGRFVSFDSKVIPVVSSDAEKIGEAVLLYVFTIAFPQSLHLSLCENQGSLKPRSCVFPDIV